MKSPLGKVVVPVDTEKKWKQLMAACQKHKCDYRWIGNEQPTEFNGWNYFKKETCLVFGYEDVLSYSDIKYCKKEKAKFLSFETAMKKLYPMKTTKKKTINYFSGVPVILNDGVKRVTSKKPQVKKKKAVKVPKEFKACKVKIEYKVVAEAVKPKKSQPKVIQEKKIEWDGFQFTKDKIILFTESRTFPVFTPTELEEHIKICQTAKRRHGKLKF